MGNQEFEGELKKLEPSKLINHGSSDVENLFLGLALIFNDLKDILSWFELLDDRYRNPSRIEVEISVHAGEYSGVRGHITRSLFALMHEFLTFVADNGKALETSEFNEILKKVPAGPRSRWIIFTEIARGNTGAVDATEFTHWLLLIRNKVASHYDGKMLRRAFEDFFSSGTPGSDQAYYSLGNSMRNTRFYFADGVAQNTVTLANKQSLKDKSTPLSPDALKQFADDMRVALYFLVRAYIKYRR